MAINPETKETMRVAVGSMLLAFVLVVAFMLWLSSCSSSDHVGARAVKATTWSHVSAGTTYVHTACAVVVIEVRDPGFNGMMIWRISIVPRPTMQPTPKPTPSELASAAAMPPGVAATR